MRWIWMVLSLAALWGVLGIPQTSLAADFVVYSVYRGLDLGNPGEAPPPKDYFVNMGSAQGVREGTVLNVMRKVATYDLLSEKLYRDVTFPIAKIKVIHVENNAAIARLDRMLPTDKTPATNPFAIMIGDAVRASAE